MTDITVSTTTFQAGGRPWLQFEAEGVVGAVPTNWGKIDFTGFTSGTHYPNGFIPSGILLAFNTVTNKLVPYANAGANGTGTPVGFLYNDIPVPADTSRATVVAYIGVFCAVLTAKLPTNNGLDSGAKTALKLVDFR